MTMGTVSGNIVRPLIEHLFVRHLFMLWYTLGRPFAV